MISFHVMAGLDPAIHPSRPVVDGRVAACGLPGHDRF